MPATKSARRRASAIATLLLFSFAICPLEARESIPHIQLPVVDRQDIRFVPLSVNGESLQTRIWSLAQDNYGVLWVGTSDALFRYDAYHLARYQNDRGPSNGLSSAPIRFLYKDRSGRLWIGTTNEGLYSLDPATDKLTSYRHNVRDPRSLSDDGLLSIFEDRSGLLWVGTQAGLDQLNPAAGTFVHYRDSNTTGRQGVVSLLEDREGNLWTGTGEGLKKLDRSTGRFLRFAHDPRDPQSLGHNYVTSIVQDQTGVLWVSSPFGSGLDAFDGKTGRFRHYSFHEEEQSSQSVVGVNRLFQDREGTLWVCSVDRGLLKFDDAHSRLDRYAKRGDDPASLPHDSVAAMFEDAEGSIWVGTGKGLTRFSKGPQRFVNYRQEPGNSNSLHENMIWSVRADSKGLIWIGTETGLNCLDRQNGRFTLYRHDAGNPHSLSYDKVSAIREDPAGALWLGTYGGGLDRFDRAAGRFFAYRHDAKDPHSLGSDSVRSLLMDRHGVLWVGTQEGGLNRFDAGTGRFTVYRSAAAYIVAIIEDRDGMFWMGSENDGLSRFDPATEQFTFYRHNPSDPASISSNRVYAIHEDRNGTLWAGTQNGLCRMDRSRGTFVTFTTRDGLAGNTVSAILEDSRGSLWVATHDGLSRLDPRTNAFRNYTESDGLPSNVLNPYYAESAFRSPAGEIILTSSKGLTTFYPEHLTDNPYVPPVLLTDFRLFNKRVYPGANSPLHKSIWATDSLQLTHAEGIFTIEFAALSYLAPEKNRYRYRLEGLETEWNEVDSSQRLATYTSLPAGAYTFRVQASNNDGVWNERGATLQVTMLPPWWSTWWFRGLLVSSLVGLAFGAHLRRMHALERQTAILEQQVSARTQELRAAKEAAEAANAAKSRFLANMSHELRTPLNAILGFSGIVRRDPALPERRRQDLDIISHSGEHLLRLINTVLDMAKIEAGRTGLDVASCDLRRLVREVVAMVRAAADEKGLKLDLVESPQFPQVVRADAGKVRQVLLNLLGNAVKFTESGSVTLRATVEGWTGQSGSVVFLVEDTGIGIAPEDQERIFDPFVQVGMPGTSRGTGLGLTITRQFMEMMGGSISVTSLYGRGSCFRIAFPAGHAGQADAAEVWPDQVRHFRVREGQPDWRVLIVDNEIVNQKLLEQVLVEAGFAVQVAANGLDAVRLFQAWRPDFIWMDVRMPVMDGLEATRRIRAMEGGREVRIVAVTASWNEPEAVLAAGLDDFLRKPYRQEEIFDCLARHLGVEYAAAETILDGQPAVRPLNREILAGVPEELRAQLRRAVISLDPKRLSEVIQRVSEVDADVALALTASAERLAYTAILRALGDSV